MMSELAVTVQLANEKVGFTSKLRENDPVAVDYYPPIGDGQGYTSLELLLMSLATCGGTGVLLLLRKQQKKIENFAVHATGIRRDAHPTILTQITLEFELVSPDIDDAVMQRVLAHAESICPVWAMLSPGTEIVTRYRIHAPQESPVGA